MGSFSPKNWRADRLTAHPRVLRACLSPRWGPGADGVMGLVAADDLVNLVVDSPEGLLVG
jgi:hypothetical protein